MGTTMIVPTEEIIYEYMRAYLKERGRELRPISNNDQQSHDQKEYIDKVCQSLNQLSDELREFIMRAHSEKFREMMNTVGNSNPSYEDYKTLANELFSDGVSWLKIVTFLVFGAELACRAMNLGVEKDDEEAGYKMVSEIINSLTKYIDENLMQWISTQDDGWMTIILYTPTLANNNENNKGMRYYFRMATLAAFVGGLYFCSKFILQK